MKTRIAFRRKWVALAPIVGYPIASPARPRPRVPRNGRVPMQLTHVLVASDLNPNYLESWPLIRRAWPLIAGLEPVLVLVARREEAPPELLTDPQVRLFEPIEGVHTAFQAQCIRLLYPSLVETAGAVLISDMELVPMNPAYFHRSLTGIDKRCFVAYRGDLILDKGEIPMPFNAALPGTWAELFGVVDEAEVRARLSEWAAQTEYEGSRGGEGWFTDQRLLYRAAIPWGEATGRLWLLDEDFTRFSRLSRKELLDDPTVSAERRRLIRRRKYSDYNSCIPHGEYRERNELVLELAAASLGRRRG